MTEATRPAGWSREKSLAMDVGRWAALAGDARELAGPAQGRGKLSCSVTRKRRSRKGLTCLRSHSPVPAVFGLQSCLFPSLEKQSERGQSFELHPILLTCFQARGAQQSPGRGSETGEARGGLAGGGLGKLMPDLRINDLLTKTRHSVPLLWHGTALGKKGGLPPASPATWEVRAPV